jgi:hypothetical protein
MTTIFMKTYNQFAFNEEYSWQNQTKIRLRVKADFV